MDLADDIQAGTRTNTPTPVPGKKLATLFYEPSTRTRLSYEAAMLNLGGSVLGFSSAASSSAAKGETCGRHRSAWFPALRTSAPCAIPRKAPPWLPPCYSSIPVINAGDGGHRAPDPDSHQICSTIRSLKGRLDNLTVGLCGDLKFGRTVALPDRRPGAGIAGVPLRADLSGRAAHSRATSGRAFWIRTTFPMRRSSGLEDRPARSWMCCT